MVELQTVNLVVPGSSPGGGAIKKLRETVDGIATWVYIRDTYRLALRTPLTL
jgi:hypothetical protein